YEGTVNQVMGDGVMALFGAPIAHEDHAVRACYAALRMQEQIRRYAEQAPRGDVARPPPAPPARGKRRSAAMRRRLAASTARWSTSGSASIRARSWSAPSAP